MNYEKIYEDLCKSRKYRGVSKEQGYEVHHITPRSFGGSNEDDNLVKLTYREHLLAHILLFKFSKGERETQMGSALKYLTKDCGRFNRSKQYESIKINVRDSLNSQGLSVLYIPTDIHTMKGIYPKDGRVNPRDVISLGFKRGYSEERLRKIRIVINSIVFARDCRYDAVRGISTISSHQICTTLIEAGMMIKFKRGRITYFSVTDKGYYFFKNSTFANTTKQFFAHRFLSCGVKQIKAWNDNNPKKLIRLCEDKKGYFYLKRISSWNYREFSNIFKELTAASKNFKTKIELSKRLDNLI